MTSIEHLLDLLELAFREPLRRREAIAAFQTLVWEGLDPALPSNVRDVLSDLAYDLDFFEPQRAIRQEDGALYGHQRAEKEIREAFAKLQGVGVSTPTLSDTSE